MPVWGWVCVGLTVAGIAVIVYANIVQNTARDYTLKNGEPVIG